MVFLMISKKSCIRKQEIYLFEWTAVYVQMVRCYTIYVRDRGKRLYAYNFISR